MGTFGGWAASHTAPMVLSMRLVLRGALAAVVGLAVALSAQPALAAGLGAEAGGAGGFTEIIVSLRSGADRAQIARDALADVERGVPGRPDLLVLRVPGAAAQSVSRALSARADVAFAAPNGVARMAAATNDLRLADQWHMLERAKAAGSSNWVPVGATNLGSGMTVAVLDTGVTPHPDLDGVLTDRDWDFIDDDDDASDPHGHGTHVAGTVAGTAGNTIGVVGVAPAASILPVRVLDAEGNAAYDVIFAGMAYAVRQGVDVINLSLAGNTDAGMCDAVSKAVAAGVVVVAAAGNDAGPVGYPAACPDAIAVSAVTLDGGSAAYSNTGSSVDLSAPGGEAADRNGDGNPDGVLQYSAFEDADPATPAGLLVPGYYYSSGTSMASPHVAGAAAIAMSLRSWLSPADVRRVLLSSATDRGAAGTDPIFGAGTLDVAATVAATNALPVLAPPAPSDPHPEPEVDGTTNPPSTDPEPDPDPATRPQPTPEPDPQPDPDNTDGNGGTPPSGSDPSEVRRLDGLDRFATAAAVSAERFDSGSSHVWLATGASFADALSTGAAAGRRSGPLLLVAGCAMPDATAAELSRLKPSSITVVGGPAAVCDGVLEHTRSLTGVQPTRVAGADRFDTAAALSRTFWAGGATTVTMASAAGFADSLGGGALGAQEGSPLLLSAPCDLPAATSDELARLRPSTVLVMGGPGAVCDAVLDRVRATGATVTRISGADRFETAARASDHGWGSGSDTVYLASGAGFADGLAAGVAAAFDGAPLLLVPACGTLPVSVREEISNLAASRVYAVGGANAICPDMVNQVAAAL